MPRSALRFFLASLFFWLFFFRFSNISFAETSPYRSADTITTDTVVNSLNHPYTNLSNCSTTDGLTCDRPNAIGYGNLYFSDFGDFGIPEGSTITHVRIRVTGKTSTPSLALFAAVSRVGPESSPFYESCQSPSDLWRMYGLNSPTITVYNVTTPTTNGILTTCLTPSNIKTNNFIFRLHYSNSFAWSANIDNFEIAFDYDLQPTPTPSPTPTPPAPFLDLPWDYQNQGFEFSNVAFNPGSWFDHEYPLQNVCCNPPVLTYTGELKNEFYRSHSGYDYGSDDGVFLGTHVLAAASGWATFKPEKDSGGAGNMIKIDHENGYQTWYEHLAIDELIISTTSGKVFVNKGQKIGEVGMTGRTTGPHIHLSVFKDANENNSFDDDYPWGLTDPLGWEGKNVDPWTQWTNDPPEKEDKRYGVKSYNLFAQRSQPKQEEIPTTGGSVSLGDIFIDIVSGTFNQAFKFIADYGPYESTDDGKIKSIMPSIFLDAFDSLGEKVTEFLQPVTITYDYKDADLFNTNEESLKIYWFNEATGQWEGLSSVVDKLNKTVTSETDHFSQFALMGEVKDLIPPVTDVVISGDKGEDNWYRSDIDIELQGQDNEGGVGLLYTLYTLNSSDWFEYADPIIFADEGTHSITYQSFDKADNKEERKTITFSIDKTPPEAEIYYSLVDKNIQFDGKDDSGSATVTKTNAGWSQQIVVADKAGNILTILGNVFNSKNLSWLSVDSLQYNDMPPVKQDRNNFLTVPLYDRKTNQLKSITQIYSVKDQNILGFVYNVATDKTKIYTYDRKNKQIFKEELAGMHLLKLTTENGTLNYSY